MTASRSGAQASLFPESESVRIFRVPKHGAVTLFGYGIGVRVDRGHLVLEDGIGCDRRHARLPRVGHGFAV
jgi:hypothetical protein